MGMKWKKTISLLMLAVLLITGLSGCGGEENKEEAGNQQGSVTKSDGGGTADSGGDSGEPAAMGRYVEKITDLSDMIQGYQNHIFQLSDGRLVITDQYGENGSIVSEDNGATWEIQNWEQVIRLNKEKTYISDMAVGPDGTRYIIYDVNKDEDETDNRLMIIKPDGTETTVEVPVINKEAEYYIRRIWISENNRVFATSLGMNIYEVKEDGSSELFLTMPEGYYRPELIKFQGNLMIIDGYGYDSFLIYDMEKKEYLEEDEVLAEFLTGNYQDRDTNGGSWFDLYFFPGEEGVIYLAGEKGMHRHVIGGSAIEQIVDKNLSAFNNPANCILGAVFLENNEFLVLFNEGKLIRYVYDPDIPTVPTERLKAYSLKEDDMLRQAITLYQSENPDVYVEYEVGMEEGSAVTREDALKSLNTKIMAGNGPDVLVLDNMPADSYIDKGLLLDLSPILSEFTGEDALFTNLVEAFRKDGGIYMMPCQVEIPILAGREKYLSGTEDLKSVADAVEKLREDNPEKSLIDTGSARGIMKIFAMASAPAWKNQDGEMDWQAVSDFLVQTKRIYDAQMEGLPESEIERHARLNEAYMQDEGLPREDTRYFRSGANPLSMVEGTQQLLCGTVDYAYLYSELTSLPRVQGLEDVITVPMSGQSRNVFYPHTLAGINAASENMERAEDFFRLMFGKENQSSTFWGFPVNRTAFEKGFVIDTSDVEEDGIYGIISFSDGEGRYAELNIYWAEDSEIDVLRGWMEKAETPYIEDRVLEDVVYEEGAKYLEGSVNLKEAVDAIEEKAALYMAE